jgi:hypothetical protein
MDESPSPILSPGPRVGRFAREGSLLFGVGSVVAVALSDKVLLDSENG